ncbi:esterase [Glaciimonas sp. PAMC28666]|uniref:esterase n=1 Tax=Glaciimonas sp. PAMC28666 TaxID=2807626 RepID=UPI0019652EBF|nr:esterase [Glaciimonas sp. PAMC28666]QRX84263.1 esterase [Glaciimonas sp. PAMC28666]
MPQNTNPINAKFAAICGVTLALTLAFAAPVSAQQTSSVTTQQAALIARPMMISRQGSFFVGGHDIFSDTLSTLPNYAASGTVTVDQMYVHYQVPVKAKPLSLTLIHGCCLTGKTWESTPDGRIGWDEYFVRKGYSTYVIDQAERGRSASDISTINSVKLGKTAPSQLPSIFAAGREDAWTIFRFGPEYQKVWPGVQFPMEALAEFWKQMVPDWSAALPTPNPTVPALSELAIKLGGTVLISHSQSGIYPFQAAAINTRDIRGIVAIEPAACPAPGGDLTPYTKMPTLVLFGDNVDTSPRWSPRLKLCRAFVEAANAAGGHAQLVVLPDLGIHGNTHMLMQDRNNLQIADWLLNWIDKHIDAKAS